MDTCTYCQGFFDQQQDPQRCQNCECAEGGWRDGCDSGPGREEGIPGVVCAGGS